MNTAYNIARYGKVVNVYREQCIGWLELKYPTRQNAISWQPCEIFIPKFLGSYGRDPAPIL